MATTTTQSAAANVVAISTATLRLSPPGGAPVAPLKFGCVT
jgi:hypothetical protein